MPERFRLDPDTVAALDDAAEALGADLDDLRSQWYAQPEQWRHGAPGKRVESWLEMVENLFAVMEEISHSAPMSQASAWQQRERAPRDHEGHGGL